MPQITPTRQRIPTHPTLVYVIKLLYYSGYSTVIIYLVGILIIKPLLLNKRKLLNGFYNFNISKLRELYTRIAARFTIVPGINVENGSGRKYTDEIMDTNDAVFTKVKFDSNVSVGNPIFKDSEYVSTCALTLRVAHSSEKTLEILSTKLDVISKNDDDYKKIYGEMSAFNNELQFVKFGRSNAIDKKRLTEEIKGKLRQMKGQVIMG